MTASWHEKVLQLNPLRVLLITAAVVCYLLTMQWAGQSKPWDDTKVIGTLIGFVLIVVSFVALELYMGERALIQPRLLKHRTVTVGCTFLFL